MLYLSEPTELGSLYSRKELLDLSAVCKKYHLLFYIDGARLGYGLASPSCDFDLPFLAQICDAFILAAPRLAPYLEKH
ncbi:threonine aldolase [Aequitasia blattaphilus]|uniref:Uncharacterized protein n=1 Tax=Aequitasia blattaphilus TaxID=2949332 RepID=A0ABT1EBN5_9FIRM|nr:hypothetical protein [Aequitasia blattaphilus]MCP1102347.1 hypothetical protein [Aequitasia blattaphilus]MCR8614987.1 hypothetical protein [Aequitasia blattaphilus]